MASNYVYSTTVAIHERRAKVASLYLQQRTQREIAEELDVSQGTVSLDLKAVQQAWRDSAIMDLNEAKQQELQRIDELEREYWQAWEASKEDAVTSTIKEKPGVIKDEKGKSQRVTAKEASLQKKGQVGNPSFLSGVQWCIERRCKLLGIDAPEKFDGTLSVIAVLKQDINEL